MATGTITVNNISSGDEGRKIIQKFGEIPGITGVGFDLETNQVQLEFLNDQILRYFVLKTLRDIGFDHPFGQTFPD
ncbi:MAG: KTSC domain-containing protein [Zoogloeaceae bacterium]|jgi:hypothetical protein|nr:KTSC domain-containing protein [Zoogloeaceae bacterium]